MCHEPDCQRGADHRTAAIAHDRKAGRHATAIGKPFDQCRYRRDVPNPLPDAAERGYEVDQPQLMQRDRSAEQYQSDPPASGGDQPAFARPSMFEPTAPDGGGYAQQSDENLENMSDGGHRPVAGGRREHRGEGLRRARCGVGCRQEVAHRQPEDGKTVRHPDAQVDRKRGRRNQPAVESRTGNGSLSRQHST